MLFVWYPNICPVSLICITYNVVIHVFCVVVYRIQNLNYLYIYIKPVCNTMRIHLIMFSFLFCILFLKTIKQIVESNQPIWPVILFANINQSSYYLYAVQRYDVPLSQRLMICGRTQLVYCGWKGGNHKKY